MTTTTKNAPATKSKVDKALAQFGDLKIQRGNGYIYFSGEITNGWKATGIYGTAYLRDYTVEEIVEIAKTYIAENK